MCNCMNNIQNPFEHLSSKIPENERDVVRSAIINTYRNTLTTEEMTTLFRVWNTYVTPDELQDMNCRGCRTKVIGKLREVVKLWANDNQ